MATKTTTVLLLLLGWVAVLAVAADDADTVGDAGNMKLLMKLVTECSRKEEFGICLKMRAFTFLDKLSRIPDPVPLTDYLTLVRDPNAVNKVQEQRSLTETELESVLPRSLDEKSSKLDDMLWDKVSNLFGTRTIQFTMPTGMFEGRGDKIGKGGKKGMGGMMMMAAMMMGMGMKMAMGKIALIAGKALMIAKIALVLSLVMALKKFAGGGSASYSDVVYTSSDHGGHRRSGPDSSFMDYAQQLAYSAQKPNPSLM